MTGQIVDVHHHIIPKIYKDELKKQVSLVLAVFLSKTGRLKTVLK